MRVEYNELMEKLGVGYALSAYETRPWFFYDAEQGISCSAEVRVGPGADDVELEIQFLYDERDESDEDGSGDEDMYRPEGPEQILLMRFLPTKDQVWSESRMFVRGEDFANKIHNWGERGCDFFCLCIGSLQMSELPDIDDLIDMELTDRTRGGRGRRERVGKKGFKVEQKPMGMGMRG